MILQAWNICSWKIGGAALFLFFCFTSFNELYGQQSKTSGPKSGPEVKPITRILFLLDASASMLDPWEEKKKMDVARIIISEFADSLQTKTNVQSALRIYGHQSVNSANDCGDTKLEVAFANANAPTIKTALNRIRPKGITPLSLSLEKSALDFPVDPSAKNIVVLVTDGEESCGGDPCAVSLKMQEKHVYLKPFVIGLNLDPSVKSTMDCIGNYYNADRPETLRKIMKTVIDRVLSSASLRVNLLDADGNALETDVTMTFYDASTGEVAYNFYHTINYRGVPDTIQVDPAPTYDLLIHTIPVITEDKIQLEANKMEEINLPASQGFLKVELSGALINNNLNSKIKCLVKKKNSTQIVTIQDMNSTVKLLSGSYELEILTLPRVKIENVEVTQSTTTNVKIDVPGVLNISKTFLSYGAIFINVNGRLSKIYDLNENLTNELVGLQAGDYTVVYRSKSSRKTTESITRKFQIKSGQTLQLKL